MLGAANALKLLLVIEPSWIYEDAGREKRLRVRHAIPLSDRRSTITCSANDVILRFRGIDGRIQLDPEAKLSVDEHDGAVVLYSHPLAKEVLARKSRVEFIFISYEQVQEIVRLSAHFLPSSRLRDLAAGQPELRLDVFDLPPRSVVEIAPSGFDHDDVPWDVYGAIAGLMEDDDPLLYGGHTDHFLKAPHIVVPLLSHLAGMTADDTLRFPVQVKRIADQIRLIIEMEQSPIRVHKIEKSHLETWAAAQGKRYAFLDGGVARIAGVPGTEPTALRVGIYSVCPGDESLDTRETWQLHPYIVGDIIDNDTDVFMGDWEQVDVRRLGEAARYVLEPLTGLSFLQHETNVDMIFSQGPLINQFTMYDEGRPHFLPYLTRDFLASMGITREAVKGTLRDIPVSPAGKTMWRQFMAIYGYIATRVLESEAPFIGVVERSAGRWLAQAVLEGAAGARIINKAYVTKVRAILKRLNISDDFLFGCVLREGEFLTPVQINKNEPRRARENWQAVVEQYPRPFATVIKTSDMSFPFRVEMNLAANRRQFETLRMIYHTARLLPRYAFPVGLDIVDKYAKVPDWLSKNVSARLASQVLSKAMAQGDAHLVSQIRQLLAHTPRDFFYRPQI